MNSLAISDTVRTFAADVLEGLSASPKYLKSKYFYNKKGDEIFQEIMKLPGYYLTGCEFEILETSKQKILKILREEGESFDLIEFGAGDGFKTKVLLKHFVEENASFKYMPVDISRSVLSSLQSDLKTSLPTLVCEPLEGEYFKALSALNEIDSNRKVILFLGSNIGNFSDSEVNNFLKKLNQVINTGDKVIIGFDLKKDPKLIKQAYDDPQGVTGAFNLNLLQRINDELGGNFDLTAFKHEAVYDPESGEARSYLLSTKKQHIHLKYIQEHFYFDQWDSIHMEVSRKYDVKTIEGYAEKNGFQVVENLFDCKHYFVDSVWEKT